MPLPRLGGQGGGMATQTPLCWGYTAGTVGGGESCRLAPAAVERSAVEPAPRLQKLSLRTWE